MNSSFLNSFGALALVGLSVSLVPSSLSAGVRHPFHQDSRCARLPHGARCVNFRGERCWVAGGCHYRIHPAGGYMLFQPSVVYQTAIVQQPVIEKTVVVKQPVVKKQIVEEEAVVEEPVVEEPVVEEVVEQPAVEETVVEEPVLEESQEVVVEEPVLEEEETVVEALPEGAEVVVVKGERCWLRDGVYYRHCARGYKLCHARGSKCHAPMNHFPKGHRDFRPAKMHGPVAHMPHQAKNHGPMSKGHAHPMGGEHGKH